MQEPQVMREVIRSILIKQGAMRPSDIQSQVFAETGRWISDSNATARLRDLRKPKFGGYTIKCDPCENGAGYQYRLVN